MGSKVPQQPPTPEELAAMGGKPHPSPPQPLPRRRMMTTEQEIKLDLKLYGIAYTVDGRRVPPHSVMRYTSVEQTEVSGFTLPLKTED